MVEAFFFHVLLAEDHPEIPHATADRSSTAFLRKKGGERQPGREIGMGMGGLHG